MTNPRQGGDTPPETASAKNRNPVDGLDGPPPLECSLPVKPRPILTPTPKGAPPIWMPSGLLFQPVIPPGPPSTRIV